MRTSRRRSSIRSHSALSWTNSRPTSAGQSWPSAWTSGSERDAFLSDARSGHTREAYARALDYLGKWLELHNLPAANLTPRTAEDFIRDMRAMSGKDADSVRLTVSACSSFFTFLERRFDEICNPFRGSRARPASTWTEAVILSPAEIGVLQAEAEPALAAALAVVIETGLRVGGLPGLTVREDGTWHTVSKAHRLQAAEPLSAVTLRALLDVGLDPRRPFDPATFPRGPGRVLTKGNPEDLFVAWLKTRLARLCWRLLTDGKIGAVYSWHDLRHAFAERNAGRGLTWLRDRLGHASVGVTERYLRNVLKADTMYHVIEI